MGSRAKVFECGIRIAARPGLRLAAYALENATSWISSTTLTEMLYNLKLINLNFFALKIDFSLGIKYF